MSKYKVEILDNNTVEVFDLENPNENGAPFLRQDIHPDGREWIDKAEAQTWTDEFIAELEKPAVKPQPAE